MSRGYGYAAYQATHDVLPGSLRAAACITARRFLTCREPSVALWRAYMALPESVRWYWVARTANAVWATNDDAFREILRREATIWRRLNVADDGDSARWKRAYENVKGRLETHCKRLRRPSHRRRLSPEDRRVAAALSNRRYYMAHRDEYAAAYRRRRERNREEAA